MGWSRGWNLGPGWLSPKNKNNGTWGFADPISLVFGLVLEQGLDLGVQAGYL